MSSNTCANCGKEGSDVTNTCNKCKGVMYCNAACKKKHRHKHKKDCEESVNRAAELATKLYDEKLFKQPTQKEDCPICFLRMTPLMSAQVYMACCGKIICRGCIHVVELSDKKSARSCPFCRTPPPTSDSAMIERYKKRMKLNDARAFYNFAGFYADGLYGLHQNHAKALDLYLRSGELGHAEAYNNIGYAILNGRGVVERDAKKANHYLELAAMKGDAVARNCLGIMEEEIGNLDRALKHFMIAVEGGVKDSLDGIKRLYLDGNAAKDEYANALRSYQTYLDDTKSKQRDEAAVFDAQNRQHEVL